MILIQPVKQDTKVHPRKTNPVKMRAEKSITNASLEVSGASSGWAKAAAMSSSLNM